MVTFLVGLVLALAAPTDVAPQNSRRRSARSNTYRVIFFVLTFFSIGMLSNFKKLWQEGIRQNSPPSTVVSLFGFVIWVGLLISWLFFSGIKPPLAS